MCILYLGHTQFRLASFQICNSHTWLVATVLDISGLGLLRSYSEIVFGFMFAEEIIFKQVSQHFCFNTCTYQQTLVYIFKLPVTFNRFLLSAQYVVVGHLLYQHGLWFTHWYFNCELSPPPLRCLSFMELTGLWKRHAK